MRFKPCKLHLHSHVLGHRENITIFHLKKILKPSDICT